VSFVLDLAKSCRENEELLVDLCRFSENLVDERFVRRKYRNVLDDDDWIHLATDDTLVEMIETRKLQRVRDGSLKREKAALHLVRGPDILDSLMTDPKQSGKTRIDAVRTLDQLADPGPSRFAAEQDQVRVIINLTADTKLKDGSINPADILVIDKPIRPDHTIDTTPAQVRSIPDNSSDEPPLPVRRGPGRPKGSKNRPKVAPEQLLPFDADEEGNDDAV
jgi:hypothetical protein